MAELFGGMNNRVRMLLNVDDTVLSNDMIGSYEFSETAKRYIDSLVNRNTLTTEEQGLKESCYVYQTCLYLLPTIQNNSIKVEQTTHSKTEYMANDKEQLKESIRDRLCQCLLLLDVNISTATTNLSISNPESKYEGDYYHI